MYQKSEKTLILENNHREIGRVEINQKAVFLAKQVGNL